MFIQTLLTPIVYNIPIATYVHNNTSLLRRLHHCIIGNSCFDYLENGNSICTNIFVTFKWQVSYIPTSAKDCKFNTIRPPAVNVGKFRQLLNDNTYNDRILGEKVYHGDSYLQRTIMLKEIRRNDICDICFIWYNCFKINIFH